MFYKEFAPHKLLQPYIKCFWVFELKNKILRFERVIPDGNIDFVFHYGQRPSLLIGGMKIHKPTDFLGGHLVNAGILEFSGDLKMFGIKFFPWVSSSIYKMPAFELNNQRVSLEDIAGEWVKNYYEFMRNELNKSNYMMVIKNLQKELTRWLLSSPQNEILKYCIQAIQFSSGNANIDTISRKLGYSKRHIQKIFRTKRGKSFQYYCRLYRLQNVLNYFQKGFNETMTDLTYRSGYYDQSHFIRDFTEFTGITPKHFFAEDHRYINKNIEFGVYDNFGKKIV